MDSLKILNTSSIMDIITRLSEHSLIDELMRAVVNVVKKEIQTKYGIIDDDITYIAYSKLKEYNKEELRKKLMLFMLIVVTGLHAHSIAMIDGIKHNFEVTGDIETDFNTIISRLDDVTDKENSEEILNLMNEIESKKEDENKELIVIAETLYAIMKYILEKLEKV